MDELSIRFLEVSHLLTAIDIFSISIIALGIFGILYDLLRRRTRQYYEVAANISIGIVNGLLGLTFYGLIFILALWLVEHIAFFKIPINGWTWVLAIVVADLSYYWMHRIEHKVPLFWTLHNVHHSSTEFDLTTGLRLAWLEGLIEWIFFVPMILIGFDLVQTTISILIVVAYQTWIHTKHIPQLGKLDLILNTPSVHRVHHGSNTQYLDKNFGGIFMFWDHLFGSYQTELETVNYGLTKNIGTSNPIKINFLEWKNLYSDLKSKKTTKEKFNRLFKMQ